ncbi:MAG TPA: sigma-70 family RNA polymerase sigma factor [Pseudobacter sp.]|nr:sigma-70 family RNA polymerase sigma factor [Pseudobacter sp.]
MVSYSTYHDSDLLTSLRDGDHLAFSELYNRYWERMLYVAAAKTSSIAIAEEIVQDIFLDLWERRASLNITGTLESYLAVAVKYRVINAQAKKKREEAYRQSAILQQMHIDNSTQEQIDHEELKKRLARQISLLPDKCRLTYQLRKDEGLSQKEVAAKLRISEKAVEANITRALKALRSVFRIFF